MNGNAPPTDDEVIRALQTYAFFLAKGAPVEMLMEGSGSPKLKKPEQALDYVHGEQVYARNCVLCHGADGQGQRAGDQQVFPPLWGAQSYNWAAGMHQVNNADSPAASANLRQPTVPAALPHCRTAAPHGERLLQ